MHLTDLSNEDTECRREYWFEDDDSMEMDEWRRRYV